MSAKAISIHTLQPVKKKSALQNDSADLLGQRASKELIVGFMGAVGCGLPRIITECEEQLKALGYEVFRIKLSAFIQAQIDKGTISIPDELKDEASKVRYVQCQAGGNALRDLHGHDILAEYAINAIGRHRLASNPESSNHASTLKRVAFLIDQIKHPEEIRLLRLVYRKLFYMIGVMSTHEHRESRLKDDGLAADQVESVITRDRKESVGHGQQLEKAFKLADYFIHHPLGNADIVSSQITRFLSLVHGDNRITPTKHEYAMYIAHSAALRSGCLSRQVGASILDKGGKIIAIGTNDVPQYGGGLYGAESAKDERCYTHGEKCENEVQKRKRKEKIRTVLSKAFSNISKTQQAEIANTEEIDELIEQVYQQSGIPDLIEFSRAVHAEMDALISLARGGGGSTLGTSLYTTTFPCHNCARHIVASGIDKVYYIEPYEKSLAPEAHSDSIVVLDHDTESDEHSNKVRFIHFSGVAPKLFPDLFMREHGRKDGEGNLLQFNLTGQDSVPEKIVKEYLDSYRSFEEKIASIFDEEFNPAEPQ